MGGVKKTMPPYFCFIVPRASEAEELCYFGMLLTKKNYSARRFRKSHTVVIQVNTVLSEDNYLLTPSDATLHFKLRTTLPLMSLVPQIIDDVALI